MTIEVAAVAAVLLAPAVMLLGTLTVVGTTLALGSLAASSDVSPGASRLSLRRRLIRPSAAGSTD